MRVVAAVREVEAKNIHTGRHQRTEAICRAARRADRGDNLRVAHIFPVGDVAGAIRSARLFGLGQDRHEAAVRITSEDVPFTHV